jgi:hypothetical protein
MLGCLSLLLAVQISTAAQSTASPTAVAATIPGRQELQTQIQPAAPSIRNPTKVQPEARVFIDRMGNNLDGLIASEILKQRVPMVIVAEEREADYIITVASIKADDKWYHTIFSGKDKNEGNVRLLSVKEKSLVWEGEAGDRSVGFGNLKPRAQRKVADRLIKKMKKDLFSQ